MDALLIPGEYAKDAKPWNPRPLIDGGRQSAGISGRSVDVSRGGDAHDATIERELNDIRTKARQEGYAAGVQEGAARGQQQVVRLTQLLESASAALADLETAVASTLIDLSLDLARAVIRTELATRNDTIVSVITEALHALPEATTTGEIRLNPVDQSFVSAHLHEADIAANWRLIADPVIEAGGCRIITRACEIDATLKTRWSRAIQRIGRTDPWLDDSHVA